MKKKLLFTILFLCFGTSGIMFAQNCNPDPQYTSPGIHPDSATGFVQGYANQPYSQLVTVVIPQDTVIFSFPVPWDSTVLVGINGLPNGFTYACWNNSAQPNRCSWRGNTNGCVIITGNPTVADTGTYPLSIPTKNYIGGSTLPNNFTITYYKIRINGPTGIQNLNSNSFQVGDCFPNPFSDKTEINFNSPEVRQVSLKVYNMIGTEVYSFSMRAQKGLNKFTFDRNVLPAGIYIYTVSNGEQNITKRMVISR